MVGGISFASSRKPAEPIGLVEALSAVVRESTNYLAWLKSPQLSSADLAPWFRGRELADHFQFSQRRFRQVAGSPASK